MKTGLTENLHSQTPDRTLARDEGEERAHVLKCFTASPRPCLTQTPTPASQGVGGERLSKRSLGPRGDYHLNFSAAKVKALPSTGELASRSSFSPEHPTQQQDVALWYFSLYVLWRLEPTFQGSRGNPPARASGRIREKLVRAEAPEKTCGAPKPPAAGAITPTDRIETEQQTAGKPCEQFPVCPG